MPDVGGAFGLKMNPCREEIAIVLASRGWAAGEVDPGSTREPDGRRARREDLATVTIAADEDGTLLGGEGASSSKVRARSRPRTPARRCSRRCCSPVRTAFPRSRRRRETVHTNTQGRGSYRGPVDDRDRRARADDRLPRRASSGIDPLELRRRNVIRDDDLPYTMPTGMVYDQMTAAATLEQAAETIDYAAAARAAAARRGPRGARRASGSACSPSRPRCRSAG